MNEIVKQYWVEALRSGAYEQGFNRLERNGEFCCLGVLCDLAVSAGVTERHETDGAITVFGSNAWLLPREVVSWAGLPDKDPIVANEALTYWNDEMQEGFGTIAHLIEEYL